MNCLLLAAAPFAPVDQDYLFEARQMQALSFAVHIPIVCFGIAFPAFVLLLEGLWLRTGDLLYRTIAKRWSKVMLALFAVGVVTGTILSFELGLLWPNFMATFGEVFGLGFTLEAFSFFIEAIFIAIYVYGWDRLSPRAHFLSGIPVVVAGFMGSLMVITVNAWMNNPSGFTFEGGRVSDVRPIDALFGNDYLWHELVHMYVAGFIVAGFLTAAVYAFGWLRGRRGRYERVALVVPLTIAALAAPVQIVVGDWAARSVAREQPTKLAAFEGLYETEAGAPVHLGGWYDGDEIRYGIPLPRLLSLLSFHDPSARVEGLEEAPTDERPPVNVVRIAFQTMVGIGFVLAGISAFYVFVWLRRKRLPRSTWFYRAVVAAGPLSVVALIAGWVTTEVGRQPWVVYGQMRTEEAVTGASGVPVGYASLVLVYAGLLSAIVWILRRLARAPVEIQPGPSGVAPLAAGAARPDAEDPR
ncbi:MAG TPA: cytochrome ubiquinol oxidase subunit I [Gaiellaceae bacterium]|nr:cytochrome ubiquinol oxidase subunit I [Gaiellaceae bacterium]